MARPKSFLEREDTGVAQATEVAVGLVLILLLAWIGFNQPDQLVQNAVFSLIALGLLSVILCLSQRHLAIWLIAVSTLWLWG